MASAGTVRGRGLPALAPVSRAGARKIAEAERAVADQGEAVAPAQRKHLVFDGALPQVVKDLVTGEPPVADDAANFFEVGDIEIAHAPGEDLALAAPLLEGLDGRPWRVRTPPREQEPIPPHRLKP